MRRLFLGCLLLTLSSAAFGAKTAPPIVYNGDTLPENTEFTRKQCGVLIADNLLPEISGIACSRVTPGYIWMQSDDYETCIVASDEKGVKRYMAVNFSKKIRWDWEDLCGGVYNGTNYLFIGAFGDNEETDGNYSIIYFEEPAIDPANPSITLTPSSIKYQYPGGIKHNAEAMMYDNVDQVIYVITKVYYNVCQVFKIPFRLDYGSEMQTLEYVCDLGVITDIGMGDVDGVSRRFRGFHLVTGADISPDGKYILIKNHNNISATFSWILYWERGEGESIAETLKNRQPQSIQCYQWEWQGEAICWLDDYVFYTASDSEGEPPIFRYRRAYPEGIENVGAMENGERTKVMIGNTLYIRTQTGLYTMDGRLAK